MDYKYSATFTSKASIVNPSEQDRFVAQASLKNLSPLLPTNINAEENPDLLFFAANGAVAGLANLNDDVISPEAAIAVHETAVNKYINTDHDINKIVGFILKASLTKFGSSELITNEQAAALKEPFNMAVGGVIWRAAVPLLGKYLVNKSGETDDDAISLSWEIKFGSYSLALGSKNTFDAEIIKAEDARFGEYDALLRGNGGTGQDKNGRKVFRLIDGPALIVGYSAVSRPAAAVKGIITGDGPEEAAAPAAEAFQWNDEFALKLNEAVKKIVFSELEAQKTPLVAAAQVQKNDTSSENSQKDSVTSITPIIMKIESIDQLKAALGTHEATAAVTDFVKAIKDGSEAFITQLEAEKNLVATTEAHRKTAEAKAKELEKALAEIRAELDQVRASAEQAALQQKFQERMASFAEEFDLNEAEKGMIAKRVKDMDDESFASYFEECKVLMAAKKKGAFPPKKDDEKKEDKSDECKAGEIKSAVASITEDKSQASLPNSQITDDSQDMLKRMKEAFGESIKVNGKSITEQKS